MIFSILLSRKLRLAQVTDLPAMFIHSVAELGSYPKHFIKDLQPTASIAGTICSLSISLRCAGSSFISDQEAEGFPIQ